MPEPAYEDLFVSAADGLALHLRDYGPHNDALAVVCLAGLSRTCADFEDLAVALAGGEVPRRVIALDSRGRGRSEHDRNPQNYTLATELADLISVLAAIEIGPAVFVGTSRGGLLSMLLAAARPTAIAGVVLNDIGPVIEMAGLLRIKSYVGRLPAPRTFEEASEILSAVGAAQFPRLTREDWRRQAARTWSGEDGRLVLAYDPNIAVPLLSIDPATPPPALWPQFDALAEVPLMVVRGANSDLLSPATVAAMAARRPDLVHIEVPDQGHPPLIEGEAMIAAIAGFVARCESKLENVLRQRGAA